MPETVTFIHAADLHLGAPFKGLRTSSGAWAKRLADAIPEAYDRLVNAALERRVDFVVMAGDLFDSARPSYSDYARFIEGIERLAEAGIPVYFCTGNHDPYTSWQRDYGKLPANAHMFPAGEDGGFFLHERDGKPLALLAGRGYYNQTWSHERDIAEGLTRAAAEQALGVRAPFAVGVLHTGLDIDPTKAPTSPATLLRAGMDYWALGHIHRPYQDNPENPRIAFSGCIQGRAPKNTGAHGVYLVALTQGQPNHAEFIPTASVEWEHVKLDISGCATLAEVADAAMEELFRLNGEASCGEMIERITLCGTTPLHATLRQPGVLEDLRAQINQSHPQFYCDALTDRTRMPFDCEKALAEGLFPAVFLQTGQARAANRAEEIAYLQQEFIDRNLGISNVPEAALIRLEQRAEALVLDLLGEEREA